MSNINIKVVTPPPVKVPPTKVVIELDFDDAAWLVALLGNQSTADWDAALERGQAGATGDLWHKFLELRPRLRERSHPRIYNPLLEALLK